MSTAIDGHVPNYDNPETRVPLLLGVQISFTAAATTVVLLRFYTRTVIREVLTAEDWIAGASLVCISCFVKPGIFDIYLTDLGSGRYIDFMFLLRYAPKSPPSGSLTHALHAGVRGGTGLHYYDVPPTVDTSIAASV